MPKSLQEYSRWLSERDLRWPRVPDIVPVKATPTLKPLRGIRAVSWSVYGTLLRISDGELLYDHPQRFRMQIPLEKVIEEFNVWQSMSRKPGAPWEYFYRQYGELLENQRMKATRHKGDTPEVDIAAIWEKLFDRLVRNGYSWDESLYGDLSELSEKAGYFFHRAFQGTEAVPQALATLQAIHEAGLPQTLLGNAQNLTRVQLADALAEQGGDGNPARLLRLNLATLSCQEKIRVPSPTLYRTALTRWAAEGVEPQEILHIGSRLDDDLAAAKRAGIRTALYAADELGLRLQKEDLKNPEIKPDRLLTELVQVRDLLQIP